MEELYVMHLVTLHISNNDKLELWYSVFGLSILRFSLKNVSLEALYSV